MKHGWKLNRNQRQWPKSLSCLRAWPNDRRPVRRYTFSRNRCSPIWNRTTDSTTIWDIRSQRPFCVRLCSAYQEPLGERNRRTCRGSQNGSSERQIEQVGSEPIQYSGLTRSIRLPISLPISSVTAGGRNGLGLPSQPCVAPETAGSATWATVASASA